MAIMSITKDILILILYKVNIGSDANWIVKEKIKFVCIYLDLLYTSCSYGAILYSVIIIVYALP